MWVQECVNSAKYSICVVWVSDAALKQNTCNIYEQNTRKTSGMAMNSDHMMQYVTTMYINCTL
mgnify:FL=1